MKKHILALIAASLCAGIVGCQESKPQLKDGEFYINEANAVNMVDNDVKISRYEDLSPAVYSEFKENIGMNFTSFVGKIPSEFSLTDHYSLAVPDPEIEGKTYKFHDYVFEFDSESGKRIKISVSPFGTPVNDTVVESDSPVHSSLNGATVTGYRLNESFYAFMHHGELDYYIEAIDFAEAEFESLILALTSDYEGTDIILSNSEGNVSNILNPADSRFFMELISDEERYIQNMPNCLMDCNLNVDGVEMQYHSDCGNLVRWDNGKCLTLTADERVQLNEVFGRYMPLGIGKNEEKVESSDLNISISKPWYSSIKSLSAEDSKTLGEILLDDSRYLNTDTDCLADFDLKVEDSLYTYHSECGTFNDTENGRILKLTESEKELINGILGNYYPLGYGIAEEQKEVSVGNTSSGSDVPNTYVKSVSDEHADRIVSVLSDESRFVDGTGDCLNDCIVAVNGIVYYYHSDCGTFNDNSNNRSLSLTDSEKEEINGILSKYISVGSDIEDNTVAIVEPFDPTGNSSQPVSPAEPIKDEEQTEPEPVQPVAYINWGISFDVENVSPTGLTIVCTQEEGVVFGDFTTGQAYVLEVKGKYDWAEVKPIVDEIYWNEIAYLININGVTKWEIDWSKLYGELPAGEYRIYKDVCGHINMVDTEIRKFYGFFEIGEPVQPVVDDEWGIQFEASNATPTGINLGYMQYGGEHPEYGYYLDNPFWIEKYVNGKWETVPYIIDEVAWPAESLGQINNSSHSLTVNWSYYYGELPAGKYRYCRNVEVYGAVDSEYKDGVHLKKPYYAEFEIVDPWGVSLTAKNVTDENLTIVCEQTGGSEAEELLTGSFYTLEKLVNNSWQKVEYLPHEYDISWTAEAWIIPENKSVEWHVNWAWLYGQLSPGKYRIGKEIMYFRGTGDYDEKMYYAEFEISDPDMLAAEEWGISLSVSDITPEGLTLYLTQKGENPGGVLTFEGRKLTDMVTDMSYWLERLEDGEWQKVPYLTADTVPTWSLLPEMIAMDATTNWPLEWENYYGVLPVGNYRIGKTISAKLPSNDIQRFNVYAEFEITQYTKYTPSELGISAKAENVTCRGLDYVVTQTGDPLGFNKYNDRGFSTKSEHSYVLERYDGISWTAVEPLKESYIYEYAAPWVPLGASTTIRIDWSEYYGELPAGKYRISKNFYFGIDTFDSANFDVWAEFEIK